MNDNGFKKISSRGLKSLSNEELIIYYENLRNYYLSLPYDEKQKQKSEKNFLKAAKIIIPTFNFLYHPKVINNSTLDEKDEKGTIYVSNHLSSLDQFPIIQAIGKDKPLTVLAKTSLLKLKRGVLYQYVGCEFIDLNSLKSMATAMEALTKDILHGRDVLIFPEGTRNTTENFLLKFSTGAAMIAQETGAKIVPYAINEDYKIMRKNHLYVRRGEPFAVGIHDNVKEATEKLEEIVRTLMWENMELEKSERNNILKEDLGKSYQKKKTNLEKQREKIN